MFTPCQLSCPCIANFSIAKVSSARLEMMPQGSSDRSITLVSRQHLKPVSALLETSLPPLPTALSTVPFSSLLRPLPGAAFQAGQPSLPPQAVGRLCAGGSACTTAPLFPPKHPYVLWAEKSWAVGTISCFLSLGTNAGTWL